MESENDRSHTDGSSGKKNWDPKPATALGEAKMEVDAHSLNQRSDTIVLFYRHCKSVVNPARP